MRDSKELVRLIYRHIRQELTNDEASELQAWIHESEKNRLFFERAVDANQLMEEIHSREEQDLFLDEDKAWEKFQSLGLHAITNRGSIFRIVWWKYAAAVILLLVCVTYFIMLRNEKGESIVKTENANKTISDKEPGKDGAILKLADGREIVLDNAANGLLVQQGKSEVVKKDGQIIYDSSKVSTDEGELEGAYNTLSTPLGRQYQLVLSDGSRVWLNAGSSITYPTAFKGKRRVVNVTGEVYMEVAKDPSKPFTVIAEGMTVQVLGTKFNIAAYTGENGVQTTLVEGTVKIKSGDRQVNLKPGQQAQATNETIIVKSNVDIQKAIAWKNGVFYFKEDNLKTIMKQIERWYDVDVVYEGNAGNEEFSGKIFRNSKLSELLQLLQASDINFKIEGRTLIIKGK
jgi:transmembrane sensor